MQNAFNEQKIQEGVRLILEGIGEDPLREGLVETPERVSRAMQELCGGLFQDPQVHFEKSFSTESDSIVVVRDIEFYSLCEHHLLPFFGKAHIAYLPPKTHKVCGLSKLARTVEVFARRLQLQERLTEQIARAIEEGTGAQGVLVRVEAQHMCMEMRGVKKPGALTKTQVVRGIFDTDSHWYEKACDVMSW